MDGYVSDGVGLLGFALILGSYGALQARQIDPHGLAYSLLNAAGAGAVIVSLIHDFNLSALLIEAFWLVISLMGVGRWLWKRRL